MTNVNSNELNKFIEENGISIATEEEWNIEEGEIVYTTPSDSTN